MQEKSSQNQIEENEVENRLGVDFTKLCAPSKKVICW